MVSTAAFHARVRGSVPGLGGLKETKLLLPHPRVKVSIVGSLRDREVACSASDRQGSNFESCVWRTVSSQSSHHPQEVLLAQFSLYVHKGGLKPDSFHFIFYFSMTLSRIMCFCFLNWTGWYTPLHYFHGVFIVFQYDFLTYDIKPHGRAAMLGAGLLTGAGMVKSQLNTQKLAARNWSSPAGLKFPSAANFPDLKGHNNIMASHLTPKVRYSIVKID